MSRVRKLKNWPITGLSSGGAARVSTTRWMGWVVVHLNQMNLILGAGQACFRPRPCSPPRL